MPKVNGPLFSMEASGKFADSLVFYKWNGINVARRHAVPGGDPTPEQEAINEKFSQAVKLYRHLNAADRNAWKKRAAGRPLTGFNLFMQKAMQAMTAEGESDFNLISGVDIIPTDSDSVEVNLRVHYPALIRAQLGLEGGAFVETIEIGPEEFEEENSEASFVIEDLEPGQSYSLRLVQEEQQAGSGEDPYEDIIIAGETGDYNFSTV
ncbi:hypothetical protein [Halarsenatibacter silvermanii]|uniref:Uncharacterized protein n=1 Tax=Halarsenatibacter silvermanii TaxID=321763 RepID=A0A1G9MVK7_9FIRM|nr:hypothetical protein [Halarsenatibacter silvermanii]SDL78300.1 hypothetical protein SAMN04488692_10925 [Halarsenatibacter silvermanii]